MDSPGIAVTIERSTATFYVGEFGKLLTSMDYGAFGDAYTFVEVDVYIGIHTCVMIETDGALVFVGGGFKSLMVRRSRIVVEPAPELSVIAWSLVSSWNLASRTGNAITVEDSYISIRGSFKWVTVVHLYRYSNSTPLPSVRIHNTTMNLMTASSSPAYSGSDGIVSPIFEELGAIPLSNFFVNISASTIFVQITDPIQAWHASGVINKGSMTSGAISVRNSTLLLRATSTFQTSVDILDLSQDTSTPGATVIELIGNSISVANFAIGPDMSAIGISISMMIYQPAALVSVTLSDNIIGVSSNMSEAIFGVWNVAPDGYSSWDMQRNRITVSSNYSHVRFLNVAAISSSTFLTINRNAFIGTLNGVDGGSTVRGVFVEGAIEASTIIATGNRWTADCRVTGWLEGAWVLAGGIVGSSTVVKFQDESIIGVTGADAVGISITGMSKGSTLIMSNVSIDLEGTKVPGKLTPVRIDGNISASTIILSNSTYLAGRITPTDPNRGTTRVRLISISLQQCANGSTFLIEDTILIATVGTTLSNGIATLGGEGMAYAIYFSTADMITLSSSNITIRRSHVQSTGPVALGVWIAPDTHDMREGYLQSSHVHVDHTSIVVSGYFHTAALLVSGLRNGSFVVEATNLTATAGPWSGAVVANATMPPSGFNDSCVIAVCGAVSQSFVRIASTRALLSGIAPTRDVAPQSALAFTRTVNTSRVVITDGSNFTVTGGISSPVAESISALDFSEEVDNSVIEISGGCAVNIDVSHAALQSTGLSVRAVHIECVKSSIDISDASIAVRGFSALATVSRLPLFVFVNSTRRVLYPGSPAAQIEALTTNDVSLRLSRVHIEVSLASTFVTPLTGATNTFAVMLLFGLAERSAALMLDGVSMIIDGANVASARKIQPLQLGNGNMSVSVRNSRVSVVKSVGEAASFVSLRQLLTPTLYATSGTILLEHNTFSFDTGVSTIVDLSGSMNRFNVSASYNRVLTQLSVHQPTPWINCSACTSPDTVSATGVCNAFDAKVVDSVQRYVSTLTLSAASANVRGCTRTSTITGTRSKSQSQSLSGSSTITSRLTVTRTPPPTPTRSATSTLSVSPNATVSKGSITFSMSRSDNVTKSRTLRLTASRSAEVTPSHELTATTTAPPSASQELTTSSSLPVSDTSTLTPSHQRTRSNTLILPEPLPVQAAVVAVAKATVTAATAISSAIGSPVTAVQASRANFVVNLQSCSVQLDEELDAMTNPTTLALGNDVVRFYLGAAVMNHVVVFGTFVAAFCLCLVRYVILLQRHRVHRDGTSVDSASGAERPLLEAPVKDAQAHLSAPDDHSGRYVTSNFQNDGRNAKRAPSFQHTLCWARCPSFQTFPILFLLQPTAASAVTVFRFGNGEQGSFEQIAAIASYAALIFVCGASAMAAAWLRPRHVNFVRQAELSFAQQKGKPTLQRIVYYFTHESGQWRERPGSEGYCRQFGAYFDEYTGQCGWFLCVEIVFSLALGTLTPLATGNGCFPIAIVTVVLYCLYVTMLFGLHPHSQRLNFIFALVMSLCQLLTGVVVAYVTYTQKRQDEARAAIDYMGSAGMFLALGKTVLDLAQLVHRLGWKRYKKDDDASKPDDIQIRNGGAIANFAKDLDADEMDALAERAREEADEEQRQLLELEASNAVTVPSQPVEEAPPAVEDGDLLGSPPRRVDRFDIGDILGGTESTSVPIPEAVASTEATNATMATEEGAPPPRGIVAQFDAFEETLARASPLAAENAPSPTDDAGALDDFLNLGAGTSVSMLLAAGSTDGAAESRRKKDGAEDDEDAHAAQLRSLLSSVLGARTTATSEGTAWDGETLGAPTAAPPLRVVTIADVEDLDLASPFDPDDDLL
jgi:hypothetical protein